MPDRFTCRYASVGVFFPRHPHAIEPLTLLSPLPLALAVSPAFAGMFSEREGAAKATVTTDP